MNTSPLLLAQTSEEDVRAPACKVLVTGGCGVLGAALCRALSRAGYAVLAVDRECGTGSPMDNYSVYNMDLRNYSALTRLFDSVDAVIHTAALHGYHLPRTGHSEFFANNVLGLFHVLSACAQHNVRKLVVTSSTSVYGASAAAVGNCARWYDELSPANWTDLYDITKILAEKLCATYAEEFGIDVISLRVARFVGDDYVSHNVRKLFRSVDLRDVVRAHMLALGARGDAGHRIFNISAKSPFGRHEAHDLYIDASAVIERHFPGVRRLFRRRHWKLPGRIDRVYDISRAEAQLGFSPSYNFEQFFLVEALRGAVA